jgi:hypothetical protein
MRYFSIYLSIKYSVKLIVMVFKIKQPWLGLSFSMLDYPKKFSREN